MADASQLRTQLWAMADLATPMALRVAATLRIADQIAEGICTAPALAAAVGANEDALDRLLRHLTTAGVLTRDDAGRYALTALGEVLRDDHPKSLRATLDTASAIGRADLAFVKLLHAIRTGQPAFPVHFGRSFWDDLATDPTRTASFDAQMGMDVSADAPDVAAAYDWGALGHLIDVGGGNGALLAVILRHHPTLRGTVFDLPATADAARQTLTAAGLADRADAVGGSFFDPLPPGAGGYLLSAIVHDWDDDSARAILQRCAEAASSARPAGPEDRGEPGEGGAVFVVEKIGGDGAAVRTGMDLRMLVYFGGKERTVPQLAALAAEAGLRLVAVHPAGPMAIVELRAARSA